MTDPDEEPWEGFSTASEVKSHPSYGDRVEKRYDDREVGESEPRPDPRAPEPRNDD